MPSRHYGEFELLDFSGSKSSFSVYFGAVTTISIAGFLTQFGNLRTALQGIVKGTVSRERWVGDETTLSNIPPLDDMAQRELRWLIDYYEDASPYNSWSVTVPCADTSLLSSDGWHANYSDPDMAAFVTAFEAIVKDRTSGANVIVERIQLVGKNF